jgi:hypothetical protein
MQKTVVKLATYSALAVMLGLASGCASTETTTAIEENKASIADVRKTAEDAIRLASDARNLANQALSNANAAQQCCMDQKEMVDRMHEKAMMK